MKKINLLFAVLIVISTIFVASIRSDDTLQFYVSTTGDDTYGDGSSGSPYATIAGAVNAFYGAQATSEDIFYNFGILLQEGNYTGVDNINVELPPVNITIQNENNDDNTVIFDCQFAIPFAFASSVGSFQLEYVTIQNCQRAVNIEYPTTQDYQDVYIDHVTFTNISQNAIWVEYPSSMAVEDSSFSSPAGSFYEAYIVVQGNYTSGIDILGNNFLYGSGIQILDMNGGNINSNVFANMTGSSASAPPAIYIEGGVWDINDNQFNNILATGEYSAVNFYYPTSGVNSTSNFSLDSNTFNYCQSPDYYGGAITFFNVLGEITDNTFANNFAKYGGAIYAMNSNVTVQKSTFNNNNATESGGAIDIERDSFLFLYDSSFDSNYANGTLNTLSCCSVLGSATCTATLLINDNSEGDFTEDATCVNIQYVSTNEYFESLQSYAYQPFTSSGGSLWWLWLLISFALIATIVVVGGAVGFFIYTKKKRSYESYA